MAGLVKRGRLVYNIHLVRVPVAQLDRAPDYGSGGYRFDPCQVRHFWTLIMGVRFALRGEYRAIDGEGAVGREENYHRTICNLILVCGEGNKVPGLMGNGCGVFHRTAGKAGG